MVNEWSVVIFVNIYKYKDMSSIYYNVSWKVKSTPFANIDLRFWRIYEYQILLKILTEFISPYYGIDSAFKW